MQVHPLKGKLNLEPDPSKRTAGGVALFPQPQKAATLEVCVCVYLCVCCMHVCYMYVGARVCACVRMCGYRKA